MLMLDIYDDRTARQRWVCDTQRIVESSLLCNCLSLNVLKRNNTQCVYSIPVQVFTIGISGTFQQMFANNVLLLHSTIQSILINEYRFGTMSNMFHQSSKLNKHFTISETIIIIMNQSVKQINIRKKNETMFDMQSIQLCITANTV